MPGNIAITSWWNWGHQQPRILGMWKTCSWKKLALGRTLQVRLYAVVFQERRQKCGNEGCKTFCKEARSPHCPESISMKGETVVGYSNVPVSVLIEPLMSWEHFSLLASHLATYMPEYVCGDKLHLLLTWAWFIILTPDLVVNQFASKSTAKVWKANSPLAYVPSLSEPFGLL